MDRQELLSQRSPEDLGEGLRLKERIIYANNGPRASKGEAFLRRIEQLRPKLGITRVAEISQLALTDFPVYQATRPGIFHHVAIGQNTGSQGKGHSHVQAKLSCLMESVEAFCAEPRNAPMIRGSFEFLKKHHKILHPDFILPRRRHRPKAERVPLLWTPAYHVESRSRVLVPATAAYLFIPHKSYGDPGIFPQTSSGLASGSTYLEAAVHALYELIERMYKGLWEAGDARIAALFEQEYTKFDFREFVTAHGGSYEFQLFAVWSPKAVNLPVVQCHLNDGTTRWIGWGCAGDVDTAISRAVSEAVQSFATRLSGGREDLTGHNEPAPMRLDDASFGLPRYRSLRIADLKQSVMEKRYRYLNEEFHGIVAWLHDLGFRTVCLVNLTRVGVDVPVVKAIIPHMLAPNEYSQPGGDWTQQAVIDNQFGLRGAA